MTALRRRPLAEELREILCTHIVAWCDYPLQAATGPSPTALGTARSLEHVGTG